jgi:hypothetical protein
MHLLHVTVTDPPLYIRDVLVLPFHVLLQLLLLSLLKQLRYLYGVLQLLFEELCGTKGLFLLFLVLFLC